MVDYNYKFLAEWFRQTGKTYREVMKAVGNSSANNLHDWIGDGPAQERQQSRGELVRPVPMNVMTMVRFCNHFGVPIGSFFTEDGAAADVQPVAVQPTADCQKDNGDGKVRLMELELEHARERERIKDEARQREDAIRLEYEERMNRRERELQQLIAAKDAEIRLLRGVK